MSIFGHLATLLLFIEISYILTATALFIGKDVNSDLEWYDPGGLGILLFIVFEILYWTVKLFYL